MGSAIVKKDSFSGKKSWCSWDGEGLDEVSFSGGQPLMLPPEQFLTGTVVQLIPPEEEE